jgi:hypothetical protein
MLAGCARLPGSRGDGRRRRRETRLVKLRAAAGNALLAVLSVAATLTCSEGYLRFAAPELAAPPADWAFLSDFYTPNGDGDFTWPAHRRIRYVRMHGEAVEYDVQFDTNDLGLVDARDYVGAPRVGRQIAVVGDSFTAGYHGGTPWVPALNERFHPQAVRLYNLGIGGAGFLQFESLLRSVSREVAFSDVLLVAISDDLQRPRWRLDVEGDVARFCLLTWPDWLCELRRPYFHRIDLVTEPSARVRAARDIGRLALTSLFVHVARSAERSEAERSRRIDANRNAIRAIVERFGAAHVSLVHLPTRGEVERGAYDGLGDGLREAVEAVGVQYVPALRDCAWDPAMFFRHDEHPNALGYARVTECVDAHLRERLARSGGIAAERRG